MDSQSIIHLVRISIMRILIFSVSIVVAITGCGQMLADDSFIGDYCVPKEHAISNDWALWEKNHAPSGRAFAFHGCLLGMDHCNIPKVITGGVIELWSKIDWLWDKIPEDSFYRQVLVEGTPSLEFFENKKYVILSNLSLTQDWFVWQLPKNGIDKKSAIGSGARLMAVCRNSKTTSSSRVEQLDHVILCKRYVQNPHFGLFYDFRSTAKKPSDFLELDAKVIRVVESWRCQSSSLQPRN